MHLSWSVIDLNKNYINLTVFQTRLYKKNLPITMHKSSDSLYATSSSMPGYVFLTKWAHDPEHTMSLAAANIFCRSP